MIIDYGSLPFEHDGHSLIHSEIAAQNQSWPEDNPVPEQIMPRSVLLHPLRQLDQRHLKHDKYREYRPHYPEYDCQQ